MRVAITGATGRLGAALVERLDRNHEVIPLPRAACDLADTASMEQALEGLDCEVLLNAAGLTSVEGCERDSRLAMRLNSAAPGKLALWAAGRGVRMIHFSTDYVFAGRHPGWRHEAEPAGPLNAYGRSKLAGERAVLTHPGHLVLRVSWLYGCRVPSFVDRVISLAMAGEPITAVADKWSIPTYLPDLAGWVESLLEMDAAGILHACHSGAPASWHDVATAIAEEMHANGALKRVPGVKRQALGEASVVKVERPLHSAMSNARLASMLPQGIRPWRDALGEYLGQLDQ